MKWTLRHVSWGDGENPSSSDGCGFFIARLAVATAAALVTFALSGSAWSGRR